MLVNANCGASPSSQGVGADLGDLGWCCCFGIHIRDAARESSQGALRGSRDDPLLHFIAHQLDHVLMYDRRKA